MIPQNFKLHFNGGRHFFHSIKAPKIIREQLRIPQNSKAPNYTSSGLSWLTRCAPWSSTILATGWSFSARLLAWFTWAIMSFLTLKKNIDAQLFPRFCLTKEYIWSIPTFHVWLISEIHLIEFSQALLVSFYDSSKH